MDLSADFFKKDTVLLAKELLGCYLIHEGHDGTTIGRIVETEAYLGARDAASHAYKGKTNRNRAMFGPPGRAYIYFTYGMYYCFNVTAAQEGIGEGVLIRALEPVKGIELMARRRLAIDDYKKLTPKQLISLTSGPAKLVLAMGITKELYGHDLREKPLYLASRSYYSTDEPFEIVETTRIGISQAKDLLLRFYIKDNQFISRK